MVRCEINLFESPNHVCIPGDSIHGTVKFVLGEETLFSEITMSLKGFGELIIKRKKGTDKKHSRKNINVCLRQTYVDIDHVIVDHKNDIPFPAGIHEMPFSFILPENSAPSFELVKKVDRHKVNCKITYFVEMKFKRPEIFKADKKFKTVITVGSAVKPTLLTCPISYSLMKKPYQPFQNADRIVHIKGTIDNSVTTRKGRVKAKYEITNTSTIDVRAVNMILTQEITFKIGLRSITEHKTLAVLTARSIKAGDSESVDFIMDIPSDAVTIQNCRLVSRNYFVNVVVVLPFPHRDAILKMPIEIMEQV